MTDQFKDFGEMDKKIPKNLVMIYQGKPFALKAGLEFKAHLLYKGGNWGVLTEIVERKPDYVLAKATFMHMGEALFSNYGEATKDNTNTMIHKNLLHMAVTRAECRVLRMATASAYTSAEEMDWYGNGGQKELPKSEHDDEPASEGQKKILKQLGGTIIDGMTKGQIKEKIAELSK